MGHNGSSECIIAALVTFEDGTHKLKHILLYHSRFHPVNFPHSVFDLLGDILASETIHEDHPLLNEEFLRFKFNFDCFQHFNGLNYYGERLLRNHSIVYLEEQQVHFEGTLDFSSQLDSVRNLIGSLFEEILLVYHVVRVFKLVRIHLGYPHDKAYVVALHLRRE